MEQVHMIRWIALLCIGGMLGWAAVGAEPAALPSNQWVKLSAQAASPYVYSQPFYVPSRQQVLHWGAGAGAPANDMRAWDGTAGKWITDYPSADRDELKKALGTGLGIQAKGGKGAMLASGSPVPSYVVNAVCYDSQPRPIAFPAVRPSTVQGPATIP
jgi:hypothetical protein